MTHELKSHFFHNFFYNHNMLYCKLIHGKNDVNNKLIQK